MLHFFRKYQQYFFIVITTVIILSFSFFGTYSVLNHSPVDLATDVPAFTSIKGNPINRRQLEQMILFLKSDSEDKRLFGGAWGPNFLNDGVIKRNFLETGLAATLVAHYGALTRDELEQRHTKEKGHTLYSHPQAPFISMEMVWNYFAPEMQQQYKALTAARDPLSGNAFDARVRLYLGQKRLSAPIAQQILRYQQQQYNWVTPDPRLERDDLSLFGYHTFEDWFGPTTIRLIATTIINGAEEAQRRGYHVSKEEALSSLHANAASSFRENSKSAHLGVANSDQYLHEQLRRMGLDSSQAVAIWQQVLLFRRFFGDMGHSVFVSPLPFEAFDNYANTTASGTLYRLPEVLRFGSSSAALDSYLAAVAPDSSSGLPEHFLPVEAVKENHPALVQKRYLADIATVDTKALHGRIPLRDAWEWESEESNWRQLQEAFPTVAAMDGENRDHRLEQLATLDSITRNKIDAMARSAIATRHPEWIADALTAAEPSRQTITISAAVDASPVLKGIQKNSALQALFDTTPIGDTVAPDALAALVEGGYHYRIVLLDRSDDWELLSFAEAQPQLSSAEGSGLGTKRIKEHIATIHTAMQEGLQEADNRWAATTALADEESDRLVERLPLADQWKVIATPFAASRSKPIAPVDTNAALALTPGSWSPIYTPDDGDYHFYHVASVGSITSTAASKADTAFKLLGDSAEQALLKQLLTTMDSRGVVNIESGDEEADASS